MKTNRKEFKQLVEDLVRKNVLSRLQTNSIEKTEQIWKKVVSEYRGRVKAWKDKYYLNVQSEWIYPRNKRLKLSDHPVEICILLRLMNTDDDERPLYDDEIISNMLELAERLREIEDYTAEEMAYNIENGENMQSMDQKQFFEMFVC